jgi:hypothetical protein
MTKQELEQMELTRLSALCNKVADDSSMDASMKGVATMLKQEWVKLVLREQHTRDAKTHDQIQTEKLALKARMVALLMLV